MHDNGCGGGVGGGGGGESSKLNEPFRCNNLGFRALLVSISSGDRRGHDRLGKEVERAAPYFSSSRELVSTSQWLRFRNAFTADSPLNPAPGDRPYVLRGSRDVSAPRAPLSSSVFPSSYPCSLHSSRTDSERHLRQREKSTTRRAHVVKEYQRR